MATNTTPEFEDALAGFVKAWGEMRQKRMAELHPTLIEDRLEIQRGSKFAHVVKVSAHGGHSAGAFIALKDFDSNKALGPVKMGGIYKPQSFLAPAKVCRGSIFDENHGVGNMTDYGPRYLR